MRFFWQNPANPNLEHLNLQLSPEHGPAQRLVIAVFCVLLFPVMLVLYPLGKLLLGAAMLAGQTGFYLGERCFGKVNYTAAYRGQAIRTFINNNLAANVPHINLSFRKFLYRLSGLRIGKGGFIGQHGFLEDLHPENVVLEDGAVVSFGVTVIGHGPKRNIQKIEDKMVILRRGCYVGAASVLVPGVEVGEQATVGSGSVVTKNIPAGAVAAGAPARVLYYKPGFGPPEAEEPAKA